jgi:glucose-6-phosphate isomerase
MESNGKSVDLSGARVGNETAPVIFGEPGTNGQHAFFQMLHQGASIVPIDFLVAARPLHPSPFAFRQLPRPEPGPHARTRDRRGQEKLRAQNMSPEAIDALAPHKVFEGNRPSSTFLYEQMSPRVLGQLIALYEHKVFVQGVVWNINSFDQWGVELGKELANTLTPAVANAGRSTEALDSSTAGLIARARAYR